MNELLGGEDAAWLHMDDATNPMVVDGLLELDGRLPVERLRALLERIAVEKRFRSRIVERTVGRPALVEIADFHVCDQIEHVALASDDDGALRTFISETVSRGLDRARPMWRVHLVDRPSAGSVLLCRVHHALADGFALLGVLASICDTPPASGPWHPRPSTGLHLYESAKTLKRLVTLPPDRRTSLKAALGTEKRVAWTRPIPLATVKAIARSTRASVNDVLVAVLAGALRRHLDRHAEASPGLELHAMVPVNLRADPASTDLGNRFGLVVLPLPLDISDPISRVAAVRRRMLALVGTPEPFVARALLDVAGRIPRKAEDSLVAFFGKKASLVLTNVPGPKKLLSIAGLDVKRMMFWVPQAARLGLGISILSYAGTVSIGILCDPSCVPDPGALALDIHSEMDALEREERAHLDEQLVR